MADQKNQETEPEANPSSSAIQSHLPGLQSSGITILPATSSPTVPVAAATAPASLERLDILLLMLLLLLAFLIGSFAATNSDVWLHLASGRSLPRENGPLASIPFPSPREATATHPAVTWVHQSWLYSLLFYLLYNLVGGAGLVVLKALAVGRAGLVPFANSRRQEVPLPVGDLRRPGGPGDQSSAHSSAHDRFLSCFLASRCLYATGRASRATSPPIRACFGGCRCCFCCGRTWMPGSSWAR